MDRHRRGAWLASALLFVSASALGLGFLEAASRWLMPISPGMRWIPPEAQPSAPNDANAYLAGRLRFVPNARFRQVATEFDVLTTIGRYGHRLPEPDGTPDLVLLGDSFTWGQGVGDDETFASLACRAQRRACANLARPGTGTGTQVDILEDYLAREGWRPREVTLFMLVMTGALMAGNDLADNLEYAETFPDRLTPGPHAPEAAAPSDGPARVHVDTLARPGSSPLQWLVRQRAVLLARSNLVRVVYSVAGLQLRKWFTPEAAEDRLRQSLDVTRRLLARLDADSHAFGFRYDIVLLHPIQDLARGTDRRTVEAIREIAPPGARVRSTADTLRDHPAQFYFPFDGHLNAAGHRRVAELLAAGAPPPGA